MFSFLNSSLYIFVYWNYGIQTTPTLDNLYSATNLYPYFLEVEFYGRTTSDEEMHVKWEAWRVKQAGLHLKKNGAQWNSILEYFLKICREMNKLNRNRTWLSSYWRALQSTPSEVKLINGVLAHTSSAGTFVLTLLCLGTPLTSTRQSYFLHSSVLACCSCRALLKALSEFLIQWSQLVLTNL